MGLARVCFIVIFYFFKFVLCVPLVNLSHDKKFIFTTPILSTTSPTISNKKFFLHSTFISLFHPYFLTSSSLQFPLTLPYLSNSSSPSFCVQPSRQSITKIFSLPQPIILKLWSLVRSDTVLISSFFLYRQW